MYEDPASVLLGLRRAELDRARARFDEVRDGETGCVAFVAGEPGSGRSALLHALLEYARATQPETVVVAGGFDDTGYQPWEPPESSVRTALSGVSKLADAVVTLGEPLASFDPHTAAGITVAKVANQLLAVGLMAAGAERDVVPNWRGPKEAKKLLREVAQSRPVLVLFDDLDAPGGRHFWFDLIDSFGTEISRGLPILIVAALSPDLPLSGSGRGAQSGVLGIATKLVERQVATWWKLEGMTRSSLEDSIGHLAPRVCDELLAATAGRAGWIAELWEEWVRTGAVQLTSGQWRLATASSVHQRPLRSVNDLIDARLAELLGYEDPGALAVAKRRLAIASLEGKTFTSEAVAIVAGAQSDQVRNLLARLQGGTTRPGLVQALGQTRIESRSGVTVLSRFRFNSSMYSSVLREYGLAPHEVRELSRRYASALTDLYGDARDDAATPLSNLFVLAGESALAAEYRAVAEYTRNLVAIRARVETLTFRAPRPTERGEALHFLLYAGSVMEGRVPIPERRAVFELAAEVAALLNDLVSQGQALYRLAALSIALGDVPTGLAKAAEAKRCFLSSNRPNSLALVLHLEAEVAREYERNPMKARLLLKEAVQLARAARDKGTQATMLAALGGVEVGMREYRAALSHLLDGRAVITELRAFQAGDVRTDVVDLELREQSALARYGLGETTIAVKELQDVQSAAVRMRQSDIDARASAWLGVLYANNGRGLEARGWLSRALWIYHTTRRTYSEAAIYGHMSRVVANSAAEKGRAVVCAAASVVILREIQNPTAVHAEQLLDIALTKRPDLDRDAVIRAVTDCLALDGGDALARWVAHDEPHEGVAQLRVLLDLAP